MKQIMAMFLVSFLSMVSINAYATTIEDDISPNNSACMITVDTVTELKQINVQYIRIVMIKKEEPSIVQIVMASNYYNSGTKEVKINYANAETAKSSLMKMSDNITFCKEEAIQRRKMKKIVK